MKRSKKGQRPKSEKERRRYWETQIRSSNPTIEDTTPIIDTTDTIAVAEKVEPAEYRPTKTPSRISSFFKEKATEIVIGLIITIILGFLSWGGYQLYNQNREIGEIKTNTDNISAGQTKISSYIERVEERLDGRIKEISSDVKSLDNRIDTIIDSNLKESE